MALLLIVLLFCTTTLYSVEISKEPLSYTKKLKSRSVKRISLIVLHSTELPTMKLTRTYAQTIRYHKGVGVSGHFYIDKKGKVYQYLDTNRIALHTRGYNARSIGIELLNDGRYPSWYEIASQKVDDPYTPEQLKSLEMLVEKLKLQYPTIKYLARHSDLDKRKIKSSDHPKKMIQRKIDPGPLFPYSTFSKKVDLICIKK